MSNKKKTQEAEQRALVAENQARTAQAQSDQIRAEAAKAAEQKMQLTPEAQQVLATSGKKYAMLTSGGDVSGVYGIGNFLRNTSQAMDTARRSSPRGAAGIATDAANPELLAMNEQRLKAESANDIAAGVDLLAKNAEREAVGDIMNVSGMKSGIDSNLVNFMFQNAQGGLQSAGLSQTMAESAWQRYSKERERRSPLWGLANAAVGAAGSYFTGGFKG